jgi:hypothetical protein
MKIMYWLVEWCGKHLLFPFKKYVAAIFLERGNRSLDSRAYVKARWYLKRAAQLGDQGIIAEARLRLGVIALRVGRPHCALNHLADAIQSADWEIVEAAEVFRVQALSQMGRHEEVIECCLAILNRRPISPEAFNECIKRLRQHLDPDDPRIADVELRNGALALEIATACARVPQMREMAREICEAVVAWSASAEQMREATLILNALGPDLGPHFWSTADGIGVCQRLLDFEDPKDRQREREERLQKYKQWRSESGNAKAKALYESVRSGQRAKGVDPPFLLYLRSFGIEATKLEYSEDPLSSALVKGGFADPQRSVLIDFDRPFEPWLRKMIEGRIDALAITNPLEAVASDNDILPRLEVDNDTWARIVDELIAQAAVIIQRANALTPGVQYEIERIVARDRLNDLLIVVDSVACAQRICEFVADRSTISVAIYQEKDIVRLASFDEIPLLGLRLSQLAG